MIIHRRHGALILSAAAVPSLFSYDNGLIAMNRNLT